MPEHVVLWDFDGTLGYREGLWSSALIRALGIHEPGHMITVDDVRPLLAHGFPWHEPERPHPELGDPPAWWDHAEAVVAGVFAELGYEPERCKLLARAAHEAVVDPSTHRLFSDARPALDLLSHLGWEHVIVSNHVPELESIVCALGVRYMFHSVLSSACTGYEKPNPGAFRHALEVVAYPERVWMVGDNLVADVQGAESMGIPAILVRRDGNARRRAADLLDAAAIIIRMSGS